MILTDEKLLRIPCVNALPEEIGPIIDALELELKHSAELGSGGLGLAAPQIGIYKNVAIVRAGKNSESSLEVDLVNCNIIAGFDKKIFETEGCLSFPGKYERTMRYQEIVVDNNLIGPKKFIATGLFAVVIAHELDHLSGILLPDIALPKPMLIDGKKLKPNDICFCGSNKKYKKCCL